MIVALHKEDKEWRGDVGDLSVGWLEMCKYAL